MLWCFNHVTYLDYLRLTTSRFRPSQSQGHVVNPSRNDVSVQLFALHIKEHFNKRWCQSSATAETSKTDCPWRPKKDTGDWLLPQITSELFQLRIPVNKHFLLGIYIYVVPTPKRHQLHHATIQQREYRHLCPCKAAVLRRYEALTVHLSPSLGGLAKHAEEVMP